VSLGVVSEFSEYGSESRISGCSIMTAHREVIRAYCSGEFWRSSSDAQICDRSRIGMIGYFWRKKASRLFLIISSERRGEISKYEGLVVPRLAFGTSAGPPVSASCCGLSGGGFGR